MDEKEAIDIICGETREHIDIPCEKAAKDLAYKALQKQIPQVPLKRKDINFTGSMKGMFKSGVCPSCGRYIDTNDDWYFCHHRDCGQKIDWNEGAVIKKVFVKSCPFCGRAPKMLKIEPHTHVIANMPKCHGEVIIECECGCSIMRETEEEATEAWNTRNPIEQAIRQLGKNRITAIEYNEYTASKAYETAIKIIRSGECNGSSKE